MAIFKVEGGHRLHGAITPQGAKNEALQILCATLLTPQRVVVRNIPQILDVMQLIELLRRMGVVVEQLADDTYAFCARDIDFEYLQSDDYRQRCTRLRGSVMLIGPMLARFGVGYIPKPGGDKIGRRRLDTHFLGFQKLGAKFNFDIADEFFMVEGRELRGTYMLLDEASVTGTANIIMAAVMARGFTTIYNAACEPYIQQLCKMLNRMGARISGIASNLLTIEGVGELGGTEHTLLPDMIEVGSFIGMAAMNRSELTIRNVSFENLGIIPAQFARMGIQFEQRGDDIYIPQQDHYSIETFLDGSIMNIADAPWPGLTPDLLSIFLVVATQAKGAVLIHQKMFESRLFFVDKLIDMGAQIILCDPHRATVIGHDHQMRLRATRMTSPDIRAGVALLIAAMSAEGVSTIQNIDQIDRGYKDIDGRLNALGARIARVDECAVGK
ncbi:UDP-N-acetylglucosamine 1-carboxyvinyltransferase [Alistipes timonensis JC136]|uniref:UDP-N-acetylglucosamine 1-carboxyvinyltransferase n=1 Tax=Alistipes timonensis JC136 TaxID=1033731 RepID=A0A1H4ANY9_9BACT|nr:UDP-N-acetylglucosamine 1-carboxyvinyltransferase [Alistipes timonensis]SEA37551.1 UDP-N-acetylglucosamine 1-carboxyvinyltransferase [Alistipes timonensis JC136]